MSRHDPNSGFAHDGTAEIAFSGRSLRSEGIHCFSAFLKPIWCTHDLQVRVLDWIQPIKVEDTIIGQYARSEDGKKPAFKDEEDVPDGSRCATFCAAIAQIDNERWNGVPFFLKAGKGILTPVVHKQRMLTNVKP